LEDVLVARFSAFGVTDARVRRESPNATPETDTDSSTPGADVGVVEKQLSALAQDFSKSGGLIASIEFSDGQWLNFVTPVSPIDPILTVQT
ncbi:hypothetical protein, partial [Klebsiella aerogenes]